MQWLAESGPLWRVCQYWWLFFAMTFKELSHRLLLAQFLHSPFWYQDICGYVLINFFLAFCFQASKADPWRQMCTCLPEEKWYSQYEFKSWTANLSTPLYVEGKGWKQNQQNWPICCHWQNSWEKARKKKGIRRIFKCSFPFYHVSNPIFLASFCLPSLLSPASTFLRLYNASS